MHNAQLMQVLDPSDKLPEVLTGFTFFQPFLLDDVLKQFTFTDILHHKKQLLGGFYDLIKLYNIRMSDLFKDVYLPGDPLNI